MLTDTADKARAAANVAPKIDVTDQDGVRLVRLSGRWVSQSVHLVDDKMRSLEKVADGQSIQIDASGISGLDTAGAWLVERLRQRLLTNKVDVKLEGVRESWSPLMDEVGGAVERALDVPRVKKPFFLIAFLAALGGGVVSIFDDFKMSMHILGATIRGAQLKYGRGSGIPIAAIVTQMDRMGVGAIPIIILMSTIVGAIIAQQGAFQLRYFGAEIFVVDLVGILVLRELGVLLTAIMIAGRSGSAITAEIGSMKMREETDALTVIGLNPVGVLVFPRLVALVIVLPLLTIISNLAALVGAGGVAWFYSNISPEAFISRLHDAVALNTYFAGLIKAPFMAMIIGILASVEGMKVGGSAESLGRRVTASVVKAIFVVIVVDGMFAMFYAAINF
ncbi:phospholipid/cholesterol/gamma-HCH transport system permease protein [Ochrobactrum sp. 19YEA23]|uniref:ABC transporter permease n=1 Tax=Ochrobactrum sp. 19YEA23 TaxID=3039854 RepID=UPI00247A130D|nr:phospholipid/cholesterol/gamma-HCH transport system permease protein [Ochrobactrum sp. 19YEA23]